MRKAFSIGLWVCAFIVPRNIQALSDVGAMTLLRASEFALLQVELVRNAAEAVDASQHLANAAVALGEKYFADSGIIFRGHKDYYQDYAVNSIYDNFEINRLRSAPLLELNKEKKILLADLNAFLVSEAMQKETDDFISTNTQKFSDISPMLSSIMSMIAPKNKPNERPNEDLVNNLRNYVENFEKSVAKSDGETPKMRESLQASMYLIVMVFYNNKTRFSYLYDNREVIRFMGDHITRLYGKNPLLQFAMNVAPYMDIVNRRAGIYNLASLVAIMQNNKIILAITLTALAGGVIGLYSLSRTPWFSQRFCAVGA